MAQRHLLSVDVVPSKSTTSIHLFDSSEYSSSLHFDCPRLEITAPGFKFPKVITPVQHFNMSINAITLGLVSASTPELPSLADGIYIIRYSVSPNDRVWVEYNYLKDTTLQTKIHQYRCRLKLSVCAPDQDIHDKLIKLREIDDYIKGAKSEVEYCDSPEDGMRLFNHAISLLDQIDGKKCC